MNDAPDEANPDDLMFSAAAIKGLHSEACALLLDLFVLHGRRPFTPRLEDFAGYRRWQGRGIQQKFARAVATLHVKGHLRWLPGGQYRIISKDILTVAEYRVQQQDAR